MRVLLLSAYAAQSHVYWQHGLQAMFPDWHWQVLSLPPRHFSWRVRGNPLYWALAERTTLEQPYDLVLATSMVDLATLRGLVPSLAQIPSILYFHENQFEYPQHRQQHSLLEAQMVSLYSALAADRVLFNSAYNRDSFLAGCAALLNRLPDRTPTGVVQILEEKSAVLPVPLQAPPEAASKPCWPGQPGDLPARPLRLLWSGRFEYDKGGEGLHRILLQLEQGKMDYELALTGQQFRNSPPVFQRIREEFAHRLVQFGYLDSPDDYRALQRGADVVLSTALHEFQGLAVLQAVAAGCLPALPHRLAYPEIYPRQYLYADCPGDPEREAQEAARLIGQLGQALGRGGARAPDVSAFESGALCPRYHQLFTSLANATG